MKNLLMVLILGLIIPIAARASDTENIITALKQGSAEKLSQYFDNILDIKLPEKEEVKNIGKTQAGITLRNFFDENSVNGFDLKSQRDMGGTMYLTGRLQGSKSYNITLMMKNRADKTVIVTVRINE